MAKSRVTMKKVDGDDKLSWAVLVDGRVKWDGMDRNEATWRKRKEEEALSQARTPTNLMRDPEIQRLIQRRQSFFGWINSLDKE